MTPKVGHFMNLIAFSKYLKQICTGSSFIWTTACESYFFAGGCSCGCDQEPLVLMAFFPYRRVKLGSERQDLSSLPKVKSPYYEQNRIQTRSLQYKPIVWGRQDC